MKKFLFVFGLCLICSWAYAQNYTINTIDTSSAITQGEKAYREKMTNESTQLQAQSAATPRTRCVQNKKGSWELQVKSAKQWKVISGYSTQEKCNKAITN